MFCDEVLELIEPIAAGDLPSDARILSHLASCAQCRAALEDAQRVEQALRARPKPAAPPNFTSRTISRLRRERWRSERVVDIGFNAALAAVAIGVLTAGWFALRMSGFGAVGTDAMTLFGSGISALARRVAPSVPAYLGGAVLLAAAIAIWWWAERDAQV